VCKEQGGTIAATVGKRVHCTPIEFCVTEGDSRWLSSLTHCSVQTIVLPIE